MESYSQRLFYKEFNEMITTLPFEHHAGEYETWFTKHRFVFESEVEAIRKLLPKGNTNGIEIGLGTGRFSTALGIKNGIEPALALRKIAYSRGIEVVDAIAEKLPYKDSQFDYVLMASCISYFIDVNRAFREAHRVLKKEGCLVVGFIDKNSIIGRSYESRRATSDFYKQASFYTPNNIISELTDAGFNDFSFSQTLFSGLDDIKMVESSLPGYGKGSFVLIKATKK